MPNQTDEYVKSPVKKLLDEGLLNESLEEALRREENRHRFDPVKSLTGRNDSYGLVKSSRIHRFDTQVLTLDGDFVCNVVMQRLPSTGEYFRLKGFSPSKGKYDELYLVKMVVHQPGQHFNAILIVKPCSHIKIPSTHGT